MTTEPHDVPPQAAEQKNEVPTFSFRSTRPQAQVTTPDPPARVFGTPTEAPVVAEPQNGVDLANAREIITRISSSYDSKLVGQEWLKFTLLTGLIAGGHVLLESLPGLAKTTAAQSLADSVHASFKRIQCTPDLLPSDIIGTQIYDHDTRTFETKLGPVHANFVLLDEINRSSAKTQSAMLEAMQERQTTIGGDIHHLPHPFMVIATQNPIEQEGTYRLPEAQLDRFLLKETVSYPTQEEELEILSRIQSGVLSQHNPATVNIEDVMQLQEYAKNVAISDSIKRYIVNIVNATRDIGTYLGDENLTQYVQAGASPRASIAFLTAAQALALINNRDYVIPEDVKTLRHVILRHRLLLTYEAEAENVTAESLIDRIFSTVPTP